LDNAEHEIALQKRETESHIHTHAHILKHIPVLYRRY